MGMSMGNTNLYYNVIEDIYCFMTITDSRLKKEKGWKLWSIDDEPTVEPDEDDFERDLREQEEEFENWDEDELDEWGNPIWRT